MLRKFLSSFDATGWAGQAVDRSHEQPTASLRSVPGHKAGQRTLSQVQGDSLVWPFRANMVFTYNFCGCHRQKKGAHLKLHANRW